MQYGKRADAIETFEKALGLCEGNDGLLYERALLEGKIGWTYHEMWKRGDDDGNNKRDPNKLDAAIKAKEEAVRLLESLGDAGTSDLSSAYSMLANSQIESNDVEVRKEARENAETACARIEEQFGFDREKLDNGTIDIDIDAFVDEILAVDEHAGVAAGKEHEDRVKGYAWALYFCGRVLAGGDGLAEANDAAFEGVSGSMRDDLEKAYKYELAALKIRRRLYKPGIMLFAYNCDSLAVVCEALGNFEEAKAFSEEAWALQQERHGDETGSIKANYERIKGKCPAASETL